jgi:hypothetical protein
LKLPNRAAASKARRAFNGGSERRWAGIFQVTFADVRSQHYSFVGVMETSHVFAGLHFRG